MGTRLYESEADLSILPTDKRYQHVAVGGTRNSTTTSMIVKLGQCFSVAVGGTRNSTTTSMIVKLGQCFFSISSAAVVNSVNCTRNLGDHYKTRFNNSNGDLAKIY